MNKKVFLRTFFTVTGSLILIPLAFWLIFIMTFAKGKIKDGYHINDRFGVKFKLPEDSIYRNDWQKNCLKRSLKIPPKDPAGFKKSLLEGYQVDFGWKIRSSIYSPKLCRVFYRKTELSSEHDDIQNEIECNVAQFMDPLSSYKNQKILEKEIIGSNANGLHGVLKLSFDYYNKRYIKEYRYAVKAGYVINVSYENIEEKYNENKAKISEIMDGIILSFESLK